MHLGCETMANAAEASASTARPRKKRQRRVKHQQRERTEPTRGLSKDGRLPVNEPMTGTLEHRASRSAYRLVIKEETRDGRNWEKSAKEKTDESRNPQRVRVAGA